MYSIKARSIFKKTLIAVADKIADEIGIKYNVDENWVVFYVEEERDAQMLAYVLMRAFMRAMLLKYGIQYAVQLIDIIVEKINYNRYSSSS